jgi:hypothetical protein
MRHRLTGFRAAAALTDLWAASIAAGIARRRPVGRGLERMQSDERAVKRMQLLRRQLGGDKSSWSFRIVVVLDPDKVGRVLAQAPTPFDPAQKTS